MAELTTKIIEDYSAMDADGQKTVRDDTVTLLLGLFAAINDAEVTNEMMDKTGFVPHP